MYFDVIRFEYKENCKTNITVNDTDILLLQMDAGDIIDLHMHGEPWSLMVCPVIDRKDWRANQKMKPARRHVTAEDKRWPSRQKPATAGSINHIMYYHSTVLCSSQLKTCLPGEWSRRRLRRCVTTWAVSLLCEYSEGICKCCVPPRHPTTARRLSTLPMSCHTSQERAVQLLARSDLDTSVRWRGFRHVFLL